MTDIAINALRAELNAVRSALLPQITGLTDFTALPISSEAMDIVISELAVHQRRRILVDDVLIAMQKLEQDGYPETPPVLVPPSVLDDMQVQVDAIEAALAEFRAMQEAASALITPATPEHK